MVLLYRSMFVFAILVASFIPQKASSQEVLSPSEFLGYELGSRFTRHHQVIDYYNHVAEHSNLVELEPYGTTYEGRPLITAYVASQENMARLESIRRNNLALAGLIDENREGSTNPAIVWLSYNVHGNESVSTEAAMQTLYTLVDTNNADAQSWLENTVVILDPCLNPDGRDRYVNWYNQTVGAFPNVNPAAREHDEPWPGGRTNHYYFDLNRDWAWMTQQEVEARVAHYNKWMPHIHVDFHEQGVNSPYFFAPAAEPLHEAITQWQRDFQVMIGKNHARYFDQHAWLYFTKQVFDLLYPGYGDTWPTYNGAIGMTYEQAGSGRAGLGIITLEGDTLTLKDRIDHHYTTGLSTIEVTSVNKDRVVNEFSQFFEQARTNPDGPYKGYVIKGTTHPDKQKALATHFTKQGIRFGYAAARQSANGYSYANGETTRFSVDPGDMVLTAYQPKSTLLRVLFDPNPALSDSLTYDITSWAIPYIYGVEAYASTSELTISLNQETTTTPAEPQTPNPVTPYAYLARWHSMDDARFLSDVLQHKIKVRYAEKPFSIEGESYDAGSLIITRTGNEAMSSRFDSLVKELAAKHNRTVVPVQSGFVDTGADFGSGQVHYIQPPRVAVLIGEPISSYASGEIWHFLDQQLKFPTTVMHADAFRATALDEIDVLVLPSGSYGSILSGNALSSLKTWIRSGGRLIAFESAARYLGGQDDFRLKRKEASPDPDSLARTQRRYADRSRVAVSDNVTGAIFKVDLDTTHPLAFGYTSPYYTLKRSPGVYELFNNDNDWNVGVMPENSHLSGFVGAEVQETITPGLLFGIQNMGRGDIVYFTESPLFRAFWYNGRLLVANALFLR